MPFRGCSIFYLFIYFKFYGPFLWIGFNCLKARATSRKQFTFYYKVPRISWYSFCWPRKDEKLSRPWNHLVALNTGPLDWESSALTTRPLLRSKYSKFKRVSGKNSQLCPFIRIFCPLLLYRTHALILWNKPWHCQTR